MSARLSRYEAHTTKPLFGLGLAFLFGYGIPIVDPDLPATVISAFDIASFVIWLVFAADLLLRARGSPSGGFGTWCAIRSTSWSSLCPHCVPCACSGSSRQRTC